MRDYVLIGSGVASIAAAEAIRSHDSNSKITLLGDEAVGYYSRPGLANYLFGELPEKHLLLTSEQYYKKIRINLLHKKVIHIDTANHLVMAQDGQTFLYDRLLIAVGAKASPVNVPGVNSEGVFKLDSLEDARNILAYARRARRAVVVGGGITALEIVEGFMACGLQVVYLLRGDRYWSNVLDESESRLVENQLKRHGVTILFHQNLAEIIEKKGRVHSIRTQDGTVINCDLFAYAVGITPRIELAQSAGLRIDRGILVDEYMCTSVPDVYAAGDVAQVYDPRCGKYVIDSLWVPARNQGYTAGQNMAGVAQTYCKAVEYNITRLAGLTTTIIGAVGKGSDADLHGIARGDSETWRELPDAISAQSGFDVNSVRIMIGDYLIHGAIVIGDQKLSRPLLFIIKNQLDISSIRNRLLMPGAQIPDILIEFYTQMVVKYASATQQS